MSIMTNQETYPNGLPFLKMHGLGNDFVIIDAREAESPVTDQWHARLASGILVWGMINWLC